MLRQIVPMFSRLTQKIRPASAAAATSIAAADITCSGHAIMNKATAAAMATDNFHTGVLVLSRR
jgi:hypothetical protein